MEKQVVLTEEEFKVYEAALKQVKENLVENGLTFMVFGRGCNPVHMRFYTHDDTVFKLSEELEEYKRMFNKLPKRWKEKIGWHWND